MCVVQQNQYWLNESVVHSLEWGHMRLENGRLSAGAEPDVRVTKSLAKTGWDGGLLSIVGLHRAH